MDAIAQSARIADSTNALSIADATDDVFDAGFAGGGSADG
jgi:hypothetical protein